jgi:nucleotide-binding universal stress UspA family protein
VKILFPVPREEEGRESALSLCVETAAGLGASVRAIGLVDVAGIRRSESGAPPGAIFLARQAEEQILSREREAGEAALSALREAFGRAGVPFDGEVRDGDPREELVKAAASCDLLLTSALAEFGYRGEGPGKLVLSLLRDAAVPMLLAAEEHRPVRTVVVGCGGGPRTARAVAAMVRLGLWKSGARFVLAAVDDSPKAGEARLAEPRRLLAEAGYPVAGERIVPGPKLVAFPALCEEEGADAVVLGGWGESRLNDVLGGSLTGFLSHAALYHLFLYM